MKDTKGEIIGGGLIKTVHRFEALIDVQSFFLRF